MPTASQNDWLDESQSGWRTGLVRKFYKAVYLRRSIYVQNKILNSVKNSYCGIDNAALVTFHGHTYGAHGHRMVENMERAGIQHIGLD